MTTQQENTKRIAKNTLMLYVRMLFGMLVSLYTSRVVLQALGVEDYGIYNVVGGFVAMFSMISSSLSSSVSRFLTFELGRGDMEQLKKVFSTSLYIHLALAGIVFFSCRKCRSLVSEYSNDYPYRPSLCSQLGFSSLFGSFYVRFIQCTL